MRLEIRETFAAKQDRLDIWLYIANDSVGAADALIRKILEVSGRVGEFPESGEARPKLGPAIRAVPLDNYLIYYRLESEFVYVLRILHAARDVTSEMLSD